MGFVVVIPARYASTRLPGKPLADIAGSPMIVRVMKQAMAAGAERVIVATDHPEVAEVIRQAGGEVCLTQASHNSGTERLAEVIEHYQFSEDTIVVNVQGDEPLIPPAIISQVAENLQTTDAGMATLAVAITDAEEMFNPNAVKVVVNNQGLAMYFSRAPIPWGRDNFATVQPTLPDNVLRHIGIYAYRAGFIRRYIQWLPCELENIEMLEQLRVLWYGAAIHVALACQVPGSGVDTLEDLEKVRAFLAFSG